MGESVNNGASVIKGWLIGVSILNVLLGIIYFRVTWGLLASGDSIGGCLFVRCPEPLRLHLCPQHPGKPAAEEQSGD